MNKLTCRGCGKELENCTCDVLTTSKERTTLKLIEIDDYCIICELQHGGECFDIECHIKSRHEGRLSGARQQMEADQLVVDNLQARIKDLEAINEAHQKLNGELRERIKKLEELILTKNEAEKLADVMNDYEDNVEEDAPKWWEDILAKLQKIMDKRG